MKMLINWIKQSEILSKRNSDERRKTLSMNYEQQITHTDIIIKEDADEEWREIIYIVKTTFKEKKGMKK